MSTSSQVITLEQLCQEQADLPVSHVSGTLAQSFSNSVTAAQKLLDLVSRLEKTFSSPRSLDEMLHVIATLVRQTLEVDLCMVMLKDQVPGYLTMQASSPDLHEHGVHVPSLAVQSSLLQKLYDCHTHNELPVLIIHEEEQLNPLKNVYYDTLLVVPLIADIDIIGLLYCYSSQHRIYTDEDRILLRTITNQAALAIKNRQLEEQITHTNSVKTFFDDLLSGNPIGKESLNRQASLLGCDLTRPHATMIIEIVQVEENNEPEAPQSDKHQLLTYQHAVRRVKQHIQKSSPGSLVDERENRILGIVPVGKDTTTQHLKAWLGGLLHRIQDEQRVRMFAGAGNLCHDVHDYRRGFIEAEEALQVGRCLNQEASYIDFNDLGVYRYIYPFARNNSLSDPYLEHITALARYDQQHKKSELLNTLETYLEHGGNVKEASKCLDIHRNTLLQRLERIQTLCTVNLDQYNTRLQLHVALMVHKVLITRAHGV
jgi:sugar diacid utilization regulator